MVRIHDTAARDKVELRPREPGKVSMYVCGPTVYDVPHLGHGRTAVVFDTIRRYLEWRGYDVTFVSNVTDVEDKIIARAAERGHDRARARAAVTRPSYFEQHRPARRARPTTRRTPPSTSTACST